MIEDFWHMELHNCGRGQIFITQFFVFNTLGEGLLCRLCNLHITKYQLQNQNSPKKHNTMSIIITIHLDPTIFYKYP